MTVAPRSVKRRNTSFNSACSSGVRAALEKLLAVARPIAGGWDGLHFMQLDVDSPRHILTGSPQAPVETYIKETIEGGRRSLPNRGHETAEVAPVLDKGFEDGAVHGN